MPQRFYLRFLNTNGALRSEVPEFAAYFRQAIFGSAGKPKSGDQARFHPSTNCGLVGKNRVVLGGFRFSPHFRITRPCKACSSNISGISDNIQLSRKRQRAVVGKPNNDPSLSPPHVESTATVSLGTSYRNAKQPNKATTGNAAVRYQFQSK